MNEETHANWKKPIQHTLQIFLTADGYMLFVIYKVLE